VNPILKDAAAKYNIPWVRHDFPLKMHAWSFEAAVDARWFDQKSKKLGDDYRDAIFANQPSFYNNADLMRKYTQTFAQSHGIQLPFAIDPQGKLAAAVTADYDLGVRIGIDHTPTVWVVTSHSKGAPFIEVLNVDNNLYQIIDQALADTKGSK
jgi:protein-disulfide isomerase